MTNQQQNSNENVSNNGVYNIPKQKKKIKKRWIILGIIAIVVIAGFINGKMDDMKDKKEKMQKDIRNLIGQMTQHLHKCFQHRMQNTEK